MATNGYKILLPTDGSYPAIAATVRAIEMAKDRKAKLIILHVNEPITPAGMERIAEESVLMRTAGIDGVAYAKDVAAKAGIPTEVIIREGAVVGEIIRTATEKQVDIIVMGSSTIKGLPGLYLGSVSRGVIKEAPCDVVVVKLTEDEMKKAVQLAQEIAAAMKRPAVKFDISDITSLKKFKVGIGLLVVYSITYIIFTVLGTFVKNPDSPQGLSFFSLQMFGMNLGVIFGMVVIFMAIIMAVAFNWYAGRSENGEGGE
ncbi:MAG: universal stress protein [Methanomassiliicoccales archaeon]